MPVLPIRPADGRNLAPGRPPALTDGRVWKPNRRQRQIRPIYGVVDYRHLAQAALISRPRIAASIEAGPIVSRHPHRGLAISSLNLIGMKAAVSRAVAEAGGETLSTDTIMAHISRRRGEHHRAA